MNFNSYSKKCEKFNVIFLIGHLVPERHNLIYEMLLGLSEKFNVSVVTGFPSRGLSKEEILKYQEREVEGVNENLTIFRVGSKKGEGKNLLTRFIKYIFLTRQIKKTIFNMPKGIVFITSTPPFLGYLSKKLHKNSSVIYNAQDLFPDSLISYKGWKEKSFLVKYFRKKELDVYKYTNKIVTISRDMANTINLNSNENYEVSVIKNWVNVDSIKPISRTDNILFDKYKLDRKQFFLAYGGNVGLFQNWKLVLNIMVNLSKEDVKLVIFGDGSEIEWLKKEIKEKNVDNIIILPMQPYSMVSQVYSFGNLQLVPLIKNMTKYAFPSKIAQIMSTGSPILGLFDVDSEIAKEINNNRLGYIPSKLDVENITNFIIEYKNGNKKMFDSNQIRNHAIMNYSKDKQIQKYIELINKTRSGV